MQNCVSRRVQGVVSSDEVNPPGLRHRHEVRLRVRNAMRGRPPERTMTRARWRHRRRRTPVFFARILIRPDDRSSARVPCVFARREHRVLGLARAFRHDKGLHERRRRRSPAGCPL